MIALPTKVEDSATNVDLQNITIKIVRNKLTALLIVSIAVKRAILPVNVLPTKKDSIEKVAPVLDVGL